MVGGVSWAAVFAYKKVENNNFFVLKTVNIEGNRLLNWEQLISLVGVEVGTPMRDLPLDSISHRLEALPLVSVVQINKKWPFTLQIKLQEVQPLFNLLEDNKITILSNKATVMPTDVHLAASLPYVEAVDSIGLAEAVKFLNAVAKDDEYLYQNISQVIVHKGPLYFEVFMRDSQHKIKFSPKNINKQVFAQYRLLVKGLGKKVQEAKVLDMRFQGMAVAVNLKQENGDGLQFPRIRILSSLRYWNI